MVSTRLDTTDSSEIRVLHLTDLHVGMTAQGWMWPTIRKAFIDDLRRLLDKTGAVHVVIFSGDVTQKGMVDEYKKFNEVLEEVSGVLDSFGTSPLLFPVPGNHDLVRPDVSDAATKALGRWWQDAPLRESFWKAPSNEYRALIEEAFSNYCGWFSNFQKNHSPTVEIKSGVIPGDLAAKCTIGRVNLGLIGLNSSWLQLADGDYRQRLSIDTRQLHGLTGDAPDMWCSENDFNILVTHHPSAWLHPTSSNAWRSEIYLPHRFDCHVHGHMHLPASVSIGESGSPPRRHIQGSSLFGLEHIRGGDLRIHGYSIFRLSGQRTNRRIRQWPRRALKGGDGIYKLAPDSESRSSGCMSGEAVAASLPSSEYWNSNQPLSLILNS